MIQEAAASEKMQKLNEVRDMDEGGVVGGVTLEWGQGNKTSATSSPMSSVRHYIRQ